MKSRSLTNTEIETLKNQQCFSPNWSDIKVGDGFSTESISNVRFFGKITLGNTRLLNCTIDHCEIGDHVQISNTHLVQNYHIQPNVIIENSNTIKVSETTSFGNGYEIEILNEGGGRELKIFDKLSAQLAYLLVFYRHDKDLIASVNEMIQNYAKQSESSIGNIGKGTRILNTGSILNVNIEDSVFIKGTALLENGTICSNETAPVYIGENVIAKHFIVQSGSRIDGGALVDKCFIGQAVRLGKQYSAENSAFFANAEAFHGEAVSVFAGPYTVTHHKSTLLIAGMYSFYNAGSGTNQSNHMYKLGPVHQGVIERGSKTGSFAYLLWPCRVGAYSVVMGKNTANFDTGDFPFSYINVDNEKSFLTPGMNFFTVGTKRDTEKWPQRDKRKDPEKHDLIRFDFLSPYIMQKVLKAKNLLKELYEKTPKKQESVMHKGVRIKRLMLKSTQKYYDMALAIFAGNQLIKKLEEVDILDSIQTIRAKLMPGIEQIPEKWIDMSGMIAPDNLIEDLIDSIKTGKIDHLEKLNEAFRFIYNAYDQYAWAWTTRILSEKFSLDVNDLQKERLIDLINTWETEHVKYNKMILIDAKKEFDSTSKIGFGIDGEDECKDEDFENVRGKYEENKFITGLEKEIEEITKRSLALKNALHKL